MPRTPSPTPAPASGDQATRPAPNSVRHSRCGRAFFLLPDEDPAAFERHEALWLAAWAPRDRHEHEAAAAAIRCLWREERADRLEALVLTDLFAAGRLPDLAEAEAAKSAAFKALNTLLRYRARIEREQRAAMQALEALRQRRLTSAPVERPSEPERSPPAAVPASPTPPAAAVPSAAVAKDNTPRSEPEPTRKLNRHQRRALAAINRHAA